MDDPPDREPLYRELLDAPDRDRAPNARPLISLVEDEDPGLPAELAPRVTLARRGVDHGQVCALPQDAFAQPDPMPLDARLDERWFTARPLPLEGLVEPDAALAEARLALFERLQQPGALRAWLAAEEGRLADPDALSLLPFEQPLADPQRDVERVEVNADERRLWLKTGRLSTHPEDRSLRLRLSFGEEGRQDASRDLRGHRAVASLAERLFPEAAALDDHPELVPLLEEWLEGPLLRTQHIAYWNAPQGGALFHHDAFDEPLEGGQRGVLYVQLAGATVWLALAIDDLGHRVLEFCELLAEGELPWVRERLFPKDAELERVLSWQGRFGKLLDELAKPGCGRLGRVVNHGPEFTGLLADAGHAYLLEAGDAILLPNHGLRRTAMHSVFCATEGPTFALSMALREANPAAAPGPGTAGPRPAPGRRRRRRRRR